MSLSDLCANTLYADQHSRQQEDAEKEFEDIYTFIVGIFDEDLKGAKEYEELIGDLEFEISVAIDRLGYNTDASEVLASIKSDFNLKELN